MKIDEPTANLSRPSIARICVEVDLLKDLLIKIWIGTGVGKGFWQSVLCENLPPYCSYCKKIGHGTFNFKKLLSVRSTGKDAVVDPIAAGKEFKQHDTAGFSGGE